MKKTIPKITLILLLALPFLVFTVIVGGIIVRYGRAMEAIMSMSFPEIFASELYVLVGGFIFCAVCEALLLLYAINSYARKTALLENLSIDQEKGAQLLVRRDLELTRVNDQLRKLDEAKSGFISVVAHQLRTPLSGIKWTLNLLINGDMGILTTEQKTFLMKAYESNDRMISLVNDMLGADRIESGKVRYVFQPVHLYDIIDNVLFELLPQANAKGLTVSFTSRPKDLPKVRADPEKVRAVFQNLLDNAIKYSRQKGTIEVGMKASERNEVSVWIKDDGIGIPKEQQKNIFERFFRAQNAIKLETDGSGLGLFIVKSIVERHGGKVSFESVEGHGVTFYFTLPVDSSSAQANA